MGFLRYVAQVVLLFIGINLTIYTFTTPGTQWFASLLTGIALGTFIQWMQPKTVTETKEAF